MQISLEELDYLWRRSPRSLPWDCLFVTPFWLQTVIEHLGAKGEPFIIAVKRDDEVVGIAPFCRHNNSAYFLGIPDVCDYQDVIVRPGQEKMFGRHLLEYLSKQGVNRLDLQTLRPDAAMCTVLDLLEHKSQIEITRSAIDVTYETDLPMDWEGYLMQLNGKQRHEVRRKMRRLETHGDYAYFRSDGDGEHDKAVAQFLALFQMNRKDKARFMNDTMSAYFRTLARRLAQQGMLRLYCLNVKDRPAAAVFCFDYNGTRYLYNSGYDEAYHDLSIGILSKVFSIRKGIESGCRSYDFLKGAEVYKKRIGGQEVPLYRYSIAF